jgi:hypothetical protein
VLPYLGARKLRDLTATEVDGWLATLATSLSTRTLQGVRACLNRAVRRAIARDKVKRNVVELTEVCPPPCQAARSKVMSARQADDVITKTAAAAGVLRSLQEPGPFCGTRFAPQSCSGCAEMQRVIRSAWTSRPRREQRPALARAV